MTRDQKPLETRTPTSRMAMRFVLLIGVLSFFADFTYEGARSVLGPYLASLQASAFIVGAVTGFGELLGYGLRFFSGRLADTTGKFWPITIFGYVLRWPLCPHWHSPAAGRPRRCASSPNAWAAPSATRRAM
ncbi:hypothetical protein [Rhodanobacter lindaniclasticus]